MLPPLSTYQVSRHSCQRSIVQLCWLLGSYQKPICKIFLIAPIEVRVISIVMLTESAIEALILQAQQVICQQVIGAGRALLSVCLNV